MYNKSRKEKEKMLLDALNLKVGDKVKIKQLFTDTIFEIIELENNYELKDIDGTRLSRSVSMLIYAEYVKVGKLGDELCRDYRNCLECPLGTLSWLCSSKPQQTLFSNLERMTITDKEIYNFLLDRLNKEVENVNK